MKISTNAFREFKNLILSLRDKEAGLEGGILIDLKDSMAYLSSNGTWGKIPFFSEEEEGEEVVEDNLRFYVDSAKFINITELYDNIFYDSKKGSFYYGVDTYKLEQKKVEDDFISDYIDDVFNSNSYGEVFEVTPDFKEMMKKASNYLSKDNMNPPVFRTIFCNNNRLFALSDNQLFEWKTEQSPEIQISYTVFSIINSLGSDVVVSASDNSVKVSKGTIEVITPSQKSLDAPPIDSKEFVSKYDHDTYFVIPKDVASNVFEFLSIYYKDSVTQNSAIKLYIGEEGNLIVDSTTQKDSIIRSIPVSDTNIEEMSFFVDALKLKKALSVTDSPFIKIKWSEDSYSLDIVGIDSDNIEEEYHVVFSYMKEE